MTAVAVIGGGISGIAAATRLVERGLQPRLFEADAVLGGRMGLRREGAREIELGGRNFSLRDEALLALLESYGIRGLDDYRFDSVHAGAGAHMDMRSSGNAWTRALRFARNARALGARGPKLRSLVEAARAANAGLVGAPFWVELAERTVDPTALAYFGSRVCDEVIRPWTLRMMASEPEEVYLGNLGPLLGKAPPIGKRIRGGLGVFLRAVGEKLDVRRNHRVTSIRIERDRVIGLEGVNGDGPFHSDAELVIIATPAPVAASMLPMAAELASVLGHVIYRPVATAVAQYDSVEFPGGAAGLFLPRGFASCHIARYDAESRVRFSFAGVAARQALASGSLIDLLGAGEAAFAKVGGKLGVRLGQVAHAWRPGLCAHSWMHHRTIGAIERLRSGIAGLGLTGDYLRGNLFEACVTAAREAVDRALARL